METLLCRYAFPADVMYPHFPQTDTLIPLLLMLYNGWKRYEHAG